VFPPRGVGVVVLSNFLSVFPFAIKFKTISHNKNKLKQITIFSLVSLFAK
jgi:hypothetical protein